LVQQEALQPALLVASADPPHGGPVALQARGHGVNRFASGDGQDDAGVLDLEPGQASAVGHGLQEGEIGVGDGQGTRSAATHGSVSDAEGRLYPQHTRRPEFVALLCARATSDRGSDAADSFQTISVGTNQGIYLLHNEVAAQDLQALATRKLVCLSLIPC
jgi:hypothetical protein